jgi:hypothetical protein
MRPIGSAAELENRRHQGLRLLEQGYSVSQVGRMLGCGHSAVSKWRKAYEKGGEEGIQAIPHPNVRKIAYVIPCPAGILRSQGIPHMGIPRPGLSQPNSTNSGKSHHYEPRGIPQTGCHV